MVFMMLPMHLRMLDSAMPRRVGSYVKKEFSTTIARAFTMRVLV
jgi:hypothetical protein